MPVATLPQAVQTATQGTHRMSEGDREVHPTGLDVQPLKPAAAAEQQRQQPGLSQRRRRRRRGRREQCQSHAVAGRIRRQRVLEKQRVSEASEIIYNGTLRQFIFCKISRRSPALSVNAIF